MFIKKVLVPSFWLLLLAIDAKPARSEGGAGFGHHSALENDVTAENVSGRLLSTCKMVVLFVCARWFALTSESNETSTDKYILFVSTREIVH